jgi:hypothetical protein
MIVLLTHPLLLLLKLLGMNELILDLLVQTPYSTRAINRGGPHRVTTILLILLILHHVGASPLVLVGSWAHEVRLGLIER